MIRSLSYLFFIVTIFYPKKALTDVRLAVLEFQGVGVEESLLPVFSDRVRAGVLHVSKGKQIEGEDLIILTRENILQVLKDQGLPEDCIGECVVEVAKNIGANYVISGDLIKIDSVYILTIKLHETSKSNLLGVKSAETKNKIELLSKAQELGGNVFQEGLILKESNKLPQHLSKNLENTHEGEHSSLDKKNITGDDYGAVLILNGTFTMGCFNESCSSDNPPHQVTLTKSFYLMKSEVTQGLYEKVMGKNPSKFSSCGSDCPVEKVSWYDAVEMANRLSEREGLEKCYSINGENVRWLNRNCKGWRLPTEAEWEYAARGGERYKYAGSNSVGDVAWYYGNSGDSTHSVCEKQVNGYGLCDMTGNVFEWVWDSWKRDYSSDSVVDPVHLDRSSPKRVYRGGGCYDDARYGRVSLRFGGNASYRNYYRGFRFLRTLQ